MNNQIARRYAIAIAAMAFMIRVGYALVTPSFQAPDEYPHFSYVRFMHESGGVPVQANSDLLPEELEFFQPPLYYAISAPFYPLTKLSDTRPLLPLRFLNILLSMSTIALAYFFASKLFPQNWFAVALVCTGVGLLPTYSYLSATLQNGVLATFFASLGFYLCAKAVLDKEPQRRRSRWFWVGTVAGLAILSKLSAIGFAGAVGLMLLMTRERRMDWLYKTGWFALGVASTSGWWFIRNMSLYGAYLKVAENGYAIMPPPVSWEHEKQSAITLFKTFWAVFGRTNELHYADIYRLCWLFAGLAVLGFLLWSLKRPCDLPPRLIVLFAGSIVISLAVTFYYAHNYNSDQGRYMFPALLPLFTFAALGLSVLCPARYQRWVLDTVMFTFAGVNVVVIARLASTYWQVG